MIFIIQFLFSHFALFAIISVLSKKRSGLLCIGATIFWTLFWFVAVVFVWLPNALTVVANTFGIGRGADLVLYVALVVVFFILFKISVRLELINRDLTKVVRDKTLK